MEIISGVYTSAKIFTDTNSAPHGSGRILKRGDVKSRYTVSHFKSEMEGIYSSCIGKEALDEAPFAYRGLAEIKSAIRVLEDGMSTLGNSINN